MARCRKRWRCAWIGLPDCAQTTSAATPVRRRSRAVSERSRNGLGDGPIGTAARRFRKVWIAWQAQHFRKVKYRFRGRRSTFARCCVHSLRAGGWQDAENVAAVRELGFRTVRKPPRLRRLCGGGLGRSRNGLGTVSETGPLARPREGFARFELRGRRSTFARSSIDFVAGAALSQGQVSISWQAQHFRKVLRPLSASWGMARCRKRWRCAWIGLPDCAQTTSAATPVRRRSRAVSERSRNGLGDGPIGTAARRFRKVWIAWQAQHFRKVKYRFRGRRSTFARSSDKFVAGAALSQGQVQNSWQAHHFRKVKYRICDRCSTFAKSSAKFVARAALSQGQVQILWQAQHFSKVKHTFGGRRSIFARSTFAAGARKSQLLSTKVVREVNFRSWGLKIATFKYESGAQSPLSQPGLENRNF